MTVRIKGHFDGKMIVPDEPVDWPAGTPLIVEVYSSARNPPAPTLEERLDALHRIASRSCTSPGIPLEALRRENMYGDDGR